MNLLSPAPAVHAVRVKKKIRHPWSKQGYPAGYTIDGVEGKTLTLARGETYLFDVQVPDIHPFYFTQSAAGGFSPETGLLSLDEVAPRSLGPAPVTNETIRFTVSEDAPNTFFYQCAIHKYMGGKVVVVERSSNHVATGDAAAPIDALANAQGRGVVLAPTHGVVERVSPPYAVDIYIAEDDNHDVFAPISGQLLRVESQTGEFVGTQFQVPYEKTERVFLTFQGEVQVVLWLEVGKPKYITNNVRFSVEAGAWVRAGDRIGEILLGSRSGLVLSHPATITAQPGQRVRGGEHIIGQWPRSSQTSHVWKW